MSGLYGSGTSSAVRTVIRYLAPQAVHLCNIAQDPFRDDCTTQITPGPCVTVAERNSGSIPGLSRFSRAPLCHQNDVLLDQQMVIRSSNVDSAHLKRCSICGQLATKDLMFSQPL